MLNSNTLHITDFFKLCIYVSFVTFKSSKTTLLIVGGVSKLLKFVNFLCVPDLMAKQN